MIVWVPPAHDEEQRLSDQRGRDHDNAMLGGGLVIVASLGGLATLVLSHYGAAHWLVPVLLMGGVLGNALWCMTRP